MIDATGWTAGGILLVGIILFSFAVFVNGGITGLDIFDLLDEPSSFGLQSGPGVLNCSVVSSCSGNQTAVLHLFDVNNSHAALANQSWGSYSVCCEDSAGTLNISTSGNGTAFLKLYQENNSHVEFPNQTNYNLSAFISASNNVSITCDYVSTYGNCTAGITNGTNLSNATCLVTVPNINNGTNLHVGDCNATYEVSVCCAFGAEEYELIVLVDGNETNNMTNAGEPYNITVIVKVFGVPTEGIDVWAEECNGIPPFSPVQSIQSNVTNCAYSKVKTGPGGNISYTNVPTGGAPLYGAPFTYTINFYVVVGGQVKATVPFTVINRSPPAPFARGSYTVNVPNIEGTNEKILMVFDRVSRSRIGNDIAGENFDIVVYDNGTAVGDSVTLSSGRPTGLNVTVLNSTTLSGIPNSIVRLREDSGLMHWGLIQYTLGFATTNVSNHVVNSVNTNSNGNVLFTVVPTAGFPVSSVEASIGPYSVNMTVALPDGSVISNHQFTVDRTLPEPNPIAVVYNNGEIEGFNEKVLILFDRIVYYIQ
ncbi:MAG: hypothetical protein NTW67_01580 [Candidatus Woesearchaeota archaeon]|nr:hypothetical protein [Candidatus Woesearchaeota archaeon]